jgi:hypothetical protein
MKKHILFLLLFICFAKHVIAQTKIDSLKALGRDSLIKLAVKKINSPQFHPENYDRITVKANSTKLIVEFDLSVQFIPGNYCYFDRVTVMLAGGGTSESIIGDCEMPDFYNPTAAHRKKIAFVFDAINRSNEIGHFPENKMDAGETMTITENPSYYDVEISDARTYTHFKINKASGKIYDIIDKDYAGEPVSDGYFEIK